jgi:acyl-coenzyme A thioesterase PaaI-like protein
MIVKNTNRCFACGEENPIGLKLKFQPITNGVVTEYVVKEEYEGFQSIIHGGIVATLLDEAIAWACRISGVDAMTGELMVRYKKPLYTNMPIKITGLVEKNKGKLLLGRAWIEDPNGVVIATASAKMIRANQ